MLLLKEKIMNPLFSPQVDTTPPTINNCPTNIEVTVELGTTGTLVSWSEPTATDLSGPVSLTTRTNAPGSLFPLGITAVTYRFEDSSGNPAVCSFTVTVVPSKFCIVLLV